MTRIARFTSTALIVGMLAVPALAQDDTAPSLDCPAGGQMMGHGMGGGQGQGMMMGQGMMQGGMMQGGMMGGGMMGAGPARFVEGRIAFLEAELAPTGDQRPLFDAYAEALRDQAQSMQVMHDQMMSGERPATYPERLEFMEQAMAARSESLAVLREAVTPLYESLDDTQREVFDELMGMM